MSRNAKRRKAHKGDGHKAAASTFTLTLPHPLHKSYRAPDDILLPFILVLKPAVGVEVMLARAVVPTSASASVGAEGLEREGGRLQKQ